jgi:hypothetical protein
MFPWISIQAGILGFEDRSSEIAMCNPNVPTEEFFCQIQASFLHDTTNLESVSMATCRVSGAPTQSCYIATGSLPWN